MKSKRHVREFMFFQLLGIIPVCLAFNGDFLYSFCALIIAFLFYRFDPAIRDFCENIANTKEIFWGQVALGFIFSSIAHMFPWVNTMLLLVWVVIFFIVGMFHSGKVQSFLNGREG